MAGFCVDQEAYEGEESQKLPENRHVVRVECKKMSGKIQTLCESRYGLEILLGIVTHDMAG